MAIEELKIDLKELLLLLRPVRGFTGYFNDEVDALQKSVDAAVAQLDQQASAPAVVDGDLPPLPEPNERIGNGPDDVLYDADSMRDYVLADRKECGRKAEAGQAKEKP